MIRLWPMVIFAAGFSFAPSLTLAGVLPFPDGRYVTNPDLCWMSEDQLIEKHGDRVGAMVRVLSGNRIFNAYEMVCTVLKVSTEGDQVSFRASCENEGETESVEGRYVTLTATSFRLGERVFAHCPALNPSWQFPDVAWPVENIIGLWNEANGFCRGHSPSDPRMHTGCESRETYGKMLDERGWCYGRENEAGYQMSWHVCGPNSNR
ncbi:hypothetical protein LXM94_01950 [Rhizobium sp. TRM95111]|uniref:hypothetical protein n=1 Tax=Rhizobium alarense TaxID=2846851 RepID=UPI001F459A7E|nr:hypothetical protein [Rhizobium alarense]MCF3638734.1 hypothetical protein [Rhizobium alarense]